jgi:hypothetical protein
MYLSIKSFNQFQCINLSFGNLSVRVKGQWLWLRQRSPTKRSDEVMSSDPLSNFGCLDELIQVIYQSVNRFVVLSTVSDDKWNIHLGLSGPEGRWWHGSWTAANVVKVVVCALFEAAKMPNTKAVEQGSKASDHLIESFAEKLAEVFVEGELIVGNWSPDEGAEIKVNSNPLVRSREIN